MTKPIISIVTPSYNRSFELDLLIKSICEQNFDLKMVLDSDIFEWVNKQVKMSSLLPTPTAVSYDFSNLPGN